MICFGAREGTGWKLLEFQNVVVVVILGAKARPYISIKATHQRHNHFLSDRLLEWFQVGETWRVANRD